MNLEDLKDNAPIDRIVHTPFERMREVAVWLPGLVIAVGACALYKAVEYIRSDENK